MSSQKMTILAPDQEAAFQRDMQFAPGWREHRQQLQSRWGEVPNYDSGNYDYRGAWKYGATPGPDPYDNNYYHGLSQVQVPPFAAPVDLKLGDHPTKWKQTFLDQFGANPDSVRAPQVTPEMQKFMGDELQMYYAKALLNAP